MHEGNNADGASDNGTNVVGLAPGKGQKVNTGERSAKRDKGRKATNIKRRRREWDGGDGGGEDGEDGPPPRPTPLRLSDGKNQPQSRLACPFLKHSPGRYRDYSSCLTGGWREIARVKFVPNSHLSWLEGLTDGREHILRRHRASFVCPRCNEVFSTAEECDLHHPSQCARPEKPLPAGLITKSQEVKLRSRETYKPSMTQEARWQEIYEILFPEDHSRPSPCKYMNLKRYTQVGMNRR